MAMDISAMFPPRLDGAMDRLVDKPGTIAVYSNSAVQARMKDLADQGVPPVEAAAEQLLALGEWVREDDAKRIFGRITKHIMLSGFGYEQGRGDVRIPDSKLFSKGTLFHPPMSPKPAGADESAQERLTLSLLTRAATCYAAAQRGELTPEQEKAVARALEALRSN